MRKLGLLLGTFLILLLTGCMTLPVEGRLQHSNERFLGEATGYMTGGGKLSITSMSGLECSGKFKYGMSRKTGKGTLVCSDGQKGNFIFNSNGYRGNGFGKLENGDMFTFRFGDPGYIGTQEVEWHEVENMYNEKNSNGR